jgi:hypothetical protein
LLKFRPDTYSLPQNPGFKLFYHNNSKKGNPLLAPREVLRLKPESLDIQHR